MKQKKIVWIGPKLLTKYGLMSEGKEVNMPTNVADSYIKQKLAEHVSRKEKEV